MPTIGHLIIGVLIPFLIFHVLNKKFSFEVGLYFIIGSILPDTYTIIKLFIFPDIVKYISWNITHGVVSWIIWGFGFAIGFHILFHKISKLKLKQIFIVLLSAGWLHLGLDMLTQPVRIIGDCYLSILSFYTHVMILEEQDFIVVFYFIFIIIPLLMIITQIRKITLDLNENYIKERFA